MQFLVHMYGIHNISTVMAENLTVSSIVTVVKID